MNPSKTLSVSLSLSLLLDGTAYAAGQDINALPVGGSTVSGQVNISTDGNQMNIQQSTDKGIVNWQSFNIGSAASVNFNQPDSGSVTLNRVLGSDPSSIMGSLKANGSVFISNPNGVVFGANSKVNVGGIVATTLNIRDEDFLSGNYKFSRGDNAGSVVNYGELLGKYVALLAPEVRNEGVIVAQKGSVALAAGDAVTLNIIGNELIDIQVDKATIDTLVENKRLIIADEGFVVLSAQSASDLIGQTINSGTIEAKGISTDGGEIRLLGSSFVKHSGVISADAAGNGSGGEVILLADLDNENSETKVSGSVSAKGGDESGNGGLIETSASKVRIEDSASIDTSAKNGQTGQWLLDPVDFTIGASGDITAAELQTALASNNVTIQTATGTDTSSDLYGSTGTNGDIFVNDSLAWGENELTLNASRHIYLNSPITVTGTGGLNLQFGQSGPAGGFPPPAGQYFVNSPVNLASGTTFTTKYGSDGATTNYTVITDEAGLSNIAAGLNGSYVLGADISATTNPWIPIGNAGGDILGASEFNGVLDGLGHTIDGLTRANTANSTAVGLFGLIGAGGVVQNLGLTNVDLAGLSAVGALAGWNSGLVYNVYSSGTISGSDVVGAANDDSVADIGGLVGHNFGQISSSYSSAGVTANSGSQINGMGFDGGIGGFVGVNDGGIDSSYATGNVTGIYDVGGFVGYTMGAISSSYSTGLASGSTHVGGFAGAVGDGFFAIPGLLTDTYWSSANAISASDAFNSSTKLTAAQTLNSSSWSGFDFTNTWLMYENESTPMLLSMLSPYIVTPEDKTHTYDGNAFTGFTSDSNVATPGTISGTVAYGGAATTATDAGSYEITASGLTLSLAGKQDQHGYYIVYDNGTLTIDPAALTVTANSNQQKTYGDADPALGYAITSGALVGGDALTGTLSRAAGENVGDYAISLGDLDAGSNYSLNFVSDNFTIVQKDLTVSANAGQSKTYGEDDPSIAYAITAGSLVGDDALTGSLSRVAGENVGDYDINQGNLDAGGNYNLNFVSETFGITQRPVTVTADPNQGKVEGAADPALTYSTTSGSLAFDDAYSGSLSREPGESVGNYQINQNTLTLNDNYVITYEGGVFNIRPAATAPDAGSVAKDVTSSLPDQTKKGAENSNELGISSQCEEGSTGDGCQINIADSQQGGLLAGSAVSQNGTGSTTPTQGGTEYEDKTDAEKKELAKAKEQGIEELVSRVQEKKKAVGYAYASIMAAWASMGTPAQNRGESDEEYKKRLADRQAKFDEIHKKAELLSPVFKTLSDEERKRIEKVLNVESEIEQFKEKKEAAEAELKSAKKTLTEAQERADASQKALEKAQKEADENPDSFEKQMALRIAKTTALKDKLAVKKAEVSVSEADSKASDKGSEYQTAKSKSDVMNAELVSYYADEEDKQAQAKAEEKNKAAAGAKFVNLIIGAVINVNNKNIKATEKQKEEETKNLAVSEKKKDALDKQKDKLDDLSEKAKDAEDSLKSLTESLEGDKDAPKKVGVTLQIRLVNAAIVKMQSALGAHYGQLNGDGSRRHPQHKDVFEKVTHAQEEMYNLAFKHGRSLEQLKADLERAKLLAKQSIDLINSTGGLPGNAYANAREGTESLDENRQKVAYADGVKFYSEDKAAQRYTERLKREASAAKDSAEKALTDAKAAQEAYDAVLKESQEAGDPEAVKQRLEAAKQKLDQAKNNVTVFENNFELSKRNLAQAEADRDEANKQAREAAADSVAARQAVKEADEKKAEQEKRLRELAAEKQKEVIQTKLDYADNAKKTSDTAKNDLEDLKAEKQKWEKMVTEKTEALPGLKSTKETDEKAFNDANKAVEDSNALIKKYEDDAKAYENELDNKLKAPAENALKEMQAAWNKYQKATKRRESLAFKMPSGNDPISLGLSIWNEVDKSSKKEGAESARLQAEQAWKEAKAKYQPAIDAYNAKVKQINDLVTKAEAQVETGKGLAETASAAATKYNASNLAYEQAKSDKATAETNVGIMKTNIENAKEYADYAQSEADRAENEVKKYRG